MRNISLLFLGSIFLLFGCNTSAQKTDASVDEFEKAIAQPNIQLLDVRRASEYQSGHLENALLADWTNETEFQERVKSLDKSKPIYTYCLAGARSKAATEWLIQNGFIAYNMVGGIKAWRSAGKPIADAVEVKQLSMDEYLAKIPVDKTVLVDFGAVWCPPCRKMMPVLDSLLALHGAKFTLVKIDGGEQKDICDQLKITSFPTFFIYKNGKLIWQKQGIVTINEFIAQL